MIIMLKSSDKDSFVWFLGHPEEPERESHRAVFLCHTYTVNTASNRFFKIPLIISCVLNVQEITIEELSMG